MTFDQQLTREGESLFRRRSWVPAILLVPVLVSTIVPGPGRLALDHPGSWSLVCLALGALGLIARVLTVGSVGPDTSGRNTVVGPRAARLNTTGAYSLVRHPLYAANYLLWLAPSLMPALWWLPVLTTLGYRLFYDRVILAEEAFLRRTFGTIFETWAARTPALWPFGRGWRQRLVRSELPFSLRAAARREYPGLLALGASMTGVELLLQYRRAGAFRLEWPWVALFAAIVLLTSVLRWLNHRTRALAVEGR